VGVCALILVAGLLLQGLMPNGFVLTDVKDRAERPVAAQVSEIHGEGPIRLQMHGDPSKAISFRNIWVRKL
jgi:hypothetical protein